MADEFAQYKRPSGSASSPDEFAQFKRPAGAAAPLTDLSGKQMAAYATGYKEQSDPVRAAADALTPDMKTVTDFGGDLADVGKSLFHTVTDAPKSTTEKVLSHVPLALQAKRMGEGYFDSVQASKAAAEDAHVHGETGREAVETAATALPLVGPLLHGIYGKSGGVGASRILQAASMAPEGSVIPNPVAAVIKPVARGIKNARTIDPQAAMQSVLPKPTGGTAITDVVSPKLVENVRQTAANLNLKPGDFKGAKGAENFSKAVSTASKAIDQTYNTYLKPVADIPHPLPNISEPVLAKIADAIEINNKPAALRIRSGATTLADSDLMRRTINQMTESSFNSAKTYEPAMIQALHDAGGLVRDSLYSKLEALHNMPVDALADFKRQQGEVLAAQPLADKLNASVQTAAAKDATRSLPAKIGSAYSKVKSLGSATELASRQAQGLGLVDDSARLLKHLFSDLPANGNPIGGEFPPPSSITPRSSLTVGDNPHLKGFSYTDEGVRSELGVHPSTSLKDLAARGKISRDATTGLYRINDGGFTGIPTPITRAIQPASVELGGPQDIGGSGSRSAPIPLHAPDLASQPALMRVPPAAGANMRPAPQGSANIAPVDISSGGPHPFLPEGMTENTAQLPAFLQDAIGSGKVPAGKAARGLPAAKIDMLEHTGSQADALIPQPSQIVTMPNGTRVRITTVHPDGSFDAERLR